MTIAENANERLAYKYYTDGTISSTEPDPSDDPGATGAQIQRYVSQTLSLAKGITKPNERRTDRQMAMGRHTMRTATGAINGLLSPATFADHLEAVLRGTWAAAVTASQSDFTSVAADHDDSTFTFASGDPVTKGFRRGMIIRFGGMSDADNNAKNFLIVGFSSDSNRIVTVYPAPDDMTADTTFTVAQAGAGLIIPPSGHIDRKVAWEVYDSDIGMARLFTENRMTGFQIGYPAEDNATINFNVLGRNRKVFTDPDAPFFTTPTAETTTDFLGPVGGLIRIAGQNLGVLTSLNINLDLSPNAPTVRSSREAPVTPAIFLGDAAVSGDFTVFLQDSTFLDAFDGEEELELYSYATSSDDVASAAMSIYLPRIKANSNAESENNGGKVIQCQFTAARYVGAAPGIESTTIQICDTEVAGS